MAAAADRSVGRYRVRNMQWYCAPQRKSGLHPVLSLIHSSVPVPWSRNALCRDGNSRYLLGSSCFSQKSIKYPVHLWSHVPSWRTDCSWASGILWRNDRDCTWDCMEKPVSFVACVNVQWFWEEYVSFRWPESCTKSHVRSTWILNKKGNSYLCSDNRCV